MEYLEGQISFLDWANSTPNVIDDYFSRKIPLGYVIRWFSEKLKNIKDLIKTHAISFSELRNFLLVPLIPDLSEIINDNTFTTAIDCIIEEYPEVQDYVINLINIRDKDKNYASLRKHLRGAN
jgi:hypothetical protein